MPATGRRTRYSPVASSSTAKPSVNTSRGSSAVAAAPSSAGGSAAATSSAASGRSNLRRRPAYSEDVAFEIATMASVAVVISSGRASE